MIGLMQQYMFTKQNMARGYTKTSYTTKVPVTVPAALVPIVSAALVPIVSAPLVTAPLVPVPAQVPVQVLAQVPIAPSQRL